MFAIVLYSIFSLCACSYYELPLGYFNPFKHSIQYLLPRVTFSHASGGRVNPRTVIIEITSDGIIRLIPENQVYTIRTVLGLLLVVCIFFSVKRRFLHSKIYFNVYYH